MNEVKSGVKGKPHPVSFSDAVLVAGAVRGEVEEIATLHEMSFPTARRRIERMTKRVSLRAKRDEVLSVHFEGFPFPRKARLRDRVPRDSLDLAGHASM